MNSKLYGVYAMHREANFIKLLFYKRKMCVINCRKVENGIIVGENFIDNGINLQNKTDEKHIHRYDHTTPSPHH